MERTGSVVSSASGGYRLTSQPSRSAIMSVTIKSSGVAETSVLVTPLEIVLSSYDTSVDMRASANFDTGTDDTV